MLVAAMYVIAGKLGLALALVNASATAVWPPTGIALAAILIFGPRVWPAIALGAFIVNETTAGSFTTSLAITAGNTGEALLGAYLVTRFANGCAAFNKGRDFALFVVLAGLMSTTISATVGVTTLALAGFASWPAYSSIWLTWWLGDVVGAVTITPVLVLWKTSPLTIWSRAQLLEAFALLVEMILTGWIVFFKVDYPLGFLCVCVGRIPFRPAGSRNGDVPPVGHCGVGHGDGSRIVWKSTAKRGAAFAASLHGGDDHRRDHHWRGRFRAPASRRADSLAQYGARAPRPRADG